jgi:hypothetical protein
MQTYYLSTDIRYFPVLIPTIVPDGTQTRYNKFLAFVDTLPPAPFPAPTSAKELDPFFGHYKWPEHIAPYEDRQALVNLVKADPANETETRVREAILSYFQEVAVRIDSMPHQTVIQMLSKKDG